MKLNKQEVELTKEAFRFFLIARPEYENRLKLILKKLTYTPKKKTFWDKLYEEARR